MPFLNWKESKLDLEVFHAREKTQLSLSLNSQLIQELVLQLEEVFSEKSRELRLSLSQEWTLFWKQKDEGAMALLAHPDPETWVGTIGLQAEQGRRLILAFQTLKEGQSFVLGQLFKFSNISFLDLRFSRSDS